MRHVEIFSKIYCLPVAFRPLARWFELFAVSIARLVPERCGYWVAGFGKPSFECLDLRRLAVGCQIPGADQQRCQLDSMWSEVDLLAARLRWKPTGLPERRKKKRKYKLRKRDTTASSINNARHFNLLRMSQIRK